MAGNPCKRRPALPLSCNTPRRLPVDVGRTGPCLACALAETKHPSFHDSLGLQCFNGKSFTQAVVEQLVRRRTAAPTPRRHPACCLSHPPPPGPLL